MDDYTVKLSELDDEELNLRVAKKLGYRIELEEIASEVSMYRLISPSGKPLSGYMATKKSAWAYAPDFTHDEEVTFRLLTIPESYHWEIKHSTAYTHVKIIQDSRDKIISLYIVVSDKPNKVAYAMTRAWLDMHKEG